MNHPIALSPSLLLVIMLTPFFYGCSGPPPVTPYLQVSEARTRKLMVLAAEEAGKIHGADPRLTRQLNIADTQIEREWVDDAKKTLLAARATLGSPEAVKLNDQARIGGWVSVSELSRRVKDFPTASAATDVALRELDKIEDPGKRCEYVMGLANELQYIHGKPAAAGLLDRAGPWTKSIDNLASKRQALIAFSTALFNLDDFAAGQKMLEQEFDPAWRSDVLASMARLMPDTMQQVKSVLAPSALAPDMVRAANLDSSESSPATQPFYGKTLNYDQLFKNQKDSRTSK